MERPHKFNIAKLSIRKLRSSSVLNDEDPRLRIERFAMINLRGVSTKLYFDYNQIVFHARLSIPGYIGMVRPAELTQKR